MEYSEPHHIIRYVMTLQNPTNLPLENPCDPLEPPTTQLEATLVTRLKVTSALALGVASIAR